MKGCINIPLRASLFGALCLAALLGGCGKADTAPVTAPQDQAAAQAQAAAAAQKGMARDAANRQTQQADDARRAAQK